MKTTNKLAALILILASFFSCAPVEDTEGESSQESVITVTITRQLQWSAVGATRAGEGTKFAAYLFDPSGECIEGRSGDVGENMSVSFSRASTPGTYTIYVVAGVMGSELVSSQGLTPSKAISFPSVDRDIFTGSTSVAVTASKRSYNASVTATHIMAMSSLSVLNVPSYMKSLTVEFTSMASTYSLNRTVAGTGGSKTLTLTKGQVNSNGTATWSCSDILVTPYADGTTSMPIRLVATDNSDVTHTYASTSTTVFLKNTKTSLSSNMGEVIASAISLDDTWTVQNGTFDVGEEE